MIKRDFYYLIVISILLAVITTLLEYHTVPRDCSATATHAYANGFIKGMQSTTTLFKAI